MPLSNYISVSTLKLCIAALGVFLCFFAFGVFQERVTRREYVTEGQQPEKFTYFQALVGFLCLFYYLCAQGENFSETIKARLCDEHKKLDNLFIFFLKNYERKQSNLERK